MEDVEGSDNGIFLQGLKKALDRVFNLLGKFYALDLPYMKQKCGPLCCSVLYLVFL